VNLHQILIAIILQFIYFQLENVSIGNNLASFFVNVNPDYTQHDGILGLDGLLSLGR
jgi:hypothetical protein